MDRTMLAPYKAEEKELSEKLFRKLEGLMLIYPPNEDFRRCFTVDMFLKTNQQAFFQTLHYLFRLHDPAEFKRRFYWPLTDKRAESNFRTSTVEYLKHLSSLHHLNWDIKSYLVIMPGGMKFIIFLLDLVAFIVQEQIKLREKQLGTEIPPQEITQLNLERMKRQNEFFKEYASHFINEAEVQIANLYEKTQTMKRILEDLSIEFPINDAFVKEFEESNKKLFEEKILTKSENLAALTEPSLELKLSIDRFQNRANELRKDKSGLNQTLREIFCGVDSSRLRTVNEDTTINPLIAAFVVSCSIMENWLQNVIRYNHGTNNNVTSELTVIKEELNQILIQLTDFQKKYNLNTKCRSKDALSIVMQNSSPLSLKYVCTPPIKLNVAENTNARLPLQDDTMLCDRRGNFLALTGAISKTFNEQSRDHSFSLNTSLNRSKIIDPVQLLRTIYKDTTKKSRIKIQTQQNTNLTHLSSKWKDREQMMLDAENDSITPLRRGKICHPNSLFTADEQNKQTSTAKKLSPRTFHDLQYKANRVIGPSEVQQTQQAGFVVKSSPRTPFNISIGDVTRIAFPTSIEKSPSVLFRKSSIVMKVKDASLNIRRMSTSPSGRLDSLVPLESYDAMMLENIDESKTTEYDIDSENNPNLLNMPIKLSLDLSNLNDDSIFDTSDTVLNDIF